VSKHYLGQIIIEIQIIYSKVDFNIVRYSGAVKKVISFVLNSKLDSIINNIPNKQMNVETKITEIPQTIDAARTKSEDFKN
tara:strand:- start:1037 stop:1279 length:243 start_codon:yes stop_codon:yes gene_type:complete